MTVAASQRAALAEVTQAALIDGDLADLMGRVALLVIQTLHVEQSAVWELRPGRGALRLRAGAGWRAGALDRATLDASTLAPAGHPPAALVVDWASAERRPPFLSAHGVTSSLYAAIAGRGRLFGALSADSAAPRQFDDQELLFLQSVASVLALAIERANVSTTLEQRIDERTRAIEQRLVTTAQERAVLEERQRLARDLHDSVTQALYGITLHAEVASRLLASGEANSAADNLRTLQNAAQEALDEMRLLIFELRPPILEQAGLVAALQARLSAVEGRANLETRLCVEGWSSLPATIEQALYRIAQEALNNALKHAHAKHITVQLLGEPACMSMEIADDGIGFDLAAAGETGGLGLRGIAERVAQIGAQLLLQSRPGAGTQLRVEVRL